MIHHSQNMIKTYWRSRLYEIYRKKILLRKIILKGNKLSFITDNWENYWKVVPESFRNSIYNLKEAWIKYIACDFNRNYAGDYIDAYFILLSSVIEKIPFIDENEESLLTRILSFENAVFSSTGSDVPFAAVTTNNRNPAFLSFHLHRIRLNERNDPSLLPLVVGIDNEKQFLYYHYRKQRLIKNTDENLLFFPALDHHIRQKSFQGFDKLSEILASPWDSRIDQRSKMIVDKILIPLLKKCSTLVVNPLRILDIGSGNGSFTYRVISRLAKSGVFNERKIELSLLDIMKVDEAKVFGNRTIINGLSKVEYISNDYKDWILKNGTIRQYDIVFLFRILHNFSNFNILSESLNSANNNLVKCRYRIFPHLTDYYRGISFLFNLNNEPASQEPGLSKIYYPVRVFNESSLKLNYSVSLVEKLCSIAHSTIIEDGDLTPEILIHHISKHLQNPLYVYDFSKYLRLKTNHIYWITSDEQDKLGIGEKIWPLS